MAGEENLETAKRAYAAFSAGDAEGAMAAMADDIEWITPGNSAISGTSRSRLIRLMSSPTRWQADQIPNGGRYRAAGARVQLCLTSRATSITQLGSKPSAS